MYVRGGIRNILSDGVVYLKKKKKLLNLLCKKINKDM